MCQTCINHSTKSGAPVSLPSYCCWPGVYCCSEDSGSFLEHDDPFGCSDGMPAAVHHLAMRGWNLSGSLSKPVIDAWEQLSDYGLRSIDLSSNAITGSIPRSIGKLTHMRSLNFNLNRLTGSIPKEISELAKLEHFYASFNSLSNPAGSTQPLAGLFCMKEPERLYSLILRANNFTGTVNMSHCEGLGLLDVQDNRFYGALPIGITNQNLISLRAANNMFNSSIPEALWRLPQLATLELPNNDLSGTLSPYMGTVNNLVNIRLGNNSLRGTIPGNVTTNSQMLLLELQDNPLLYGTLPDVSRMVGIRTLDLHNTSISGTIPEALGSLPYLERVDISLTHMLCCENQSHADALAAQGIDKLLPSFLRFNNRIVQFDTTRNVPMSDLDPDQPTDVLCGSVERRRQPSSVWNVLDLPITNSAVTRQKWSIGPLYSFYKNCTCTPAYVQDTQSRVPVNITQAWCDNPAIPDNSCPEAFIFRCSLKHPPQLTLAQQVALGVAGAFCVVLLAVLANTCMAHASKMRRYYIRAKTRLQGTPKHGRMSLVVTDIEGYSEIFKRAPEVMFRALVMHNGAIRAAKYANCGFVLEQEGDSFTLAFHNAFDAVAFCLQAQQALLSLQWPEGLGMDESALPSADSISARRPSRLQQRLSQLLTSGTRRRAQQLNKSAAGNTVSEGESISLHVSPSRQLSQSLAARLAGLKTPPTDPALFAGLRVRMGICTGDVPSGTPIKSSALFQLAKVVSDFGNGGQVVMDHVTFAAVKESLTVLGAVEAGGINYTRLATHRSLWTSLKVALGCTSPLDPAEEAVVLDMGAYYQPIQGANSSADRPDTLDLAGYPAPGNMQDADDGEQQQQQQSGGCCRGWIGCLQQLRSNSKGDAAGSSSGRRQRDWSSLRLFQVLPAALTGRAHVWHNQLNLKDGWRPYDMPYFDAPGSTVVPLSGGGVSFQHHQASNHTGCCNWSTAPSSRTASGSVHVNNSSAVVNSASVKAGSIGSNGSGAVQGLSNSSMALQQLPAVTMVFMSAENPEQLVRRRRSFTPKVQALLHQAVRDGLRRCGGYLCRVQEGDLRFMVAFASPVAALEWCLVVQEAAMYLPWPTEPVLLYEGCTVERDAQGHIVFRGPRIKMGVCEGVPSSIFPDHEGRADYHGPAVNMAARYADKGAKGGQIACSLELAQKRLALQQQQQQLARQAYSIKLPL
ncbi:hypothetical protein OEZ85_010869 [Tetradesmus obliquus]|uniref:Guanylate cyclase domain-containing protein n=1 Tax=Tetradesmus obliquus TaxID=3088 RepID=A0ABY8TNI7_TETOB|nr:hypothetical protein OEZ85_010869 [Tetradesmus obliquus]